jgi:hypothetical protein
VLQAIYQREYLGISHFFSKEKRPPVEIPTGVIFVLSFRIARGERRVK